MFGKESEESPIISAYIGHANNIFDRLTTRNHDKNKDFWHSTVAFVGNDDTITPAHTKYLESRCVQLAYEVNHFGYALKNGNEPAPASLPKTDIPMMEEFLANVNLLLSTIGYPLLQKVEPKTETDKENPLFYCQNVEQKTRGTARMTNEGFILYKGSVIDGSHAPAVVGRNQRLIEKLLAADTLKNDGETYLFVKDYNFSSPSAAADLVTGYSVNGWDIWKTEDGKTLDQVYRRH